MTDEGAFPPRRILLTGANGFVGRHLLPVLLATGHEVHAVGRTAPDLSHPRLTFHRIDLLSDDPDALRTVTGIGADGLVHLAWVAVPGVFLSSPENLDWVAASFRLVEAFRDGGGKRVVVAGTCFEYDLDEEILEEGRSPLAPSSLYGECKATLHRILGRASEALGISLAWAHLFHLYGPHEPRGKLVSGTIASLLQGAPALCTEGLQQRDYMHVADAAAALAALLDSPAEGAVNIATGECRPVRDLLSILGGITGRSELLQFGARPLAAGEPHRLGASVRRLSEDVGFRPGYDLESGLRDTVGWWRSTLGVAT